MLISTPFLTSDMVEENKDSIRHAFTGQYPVTSYMEWHNGQHLIAPQENGVHVPVRAIADGKVIYAPPINTTPNQDKKEDPQNYAAFGDRPEWTDKGIVIIEHTTEIGATGTTPTKLKFYSVYAQLKELAAGIAKDKKIYRKDILGKPGQIYGQHGHIHFEICLDDANINLLLGQDPKDWPAAGAIPTKDGRTDVVFGSTYIYLPANTPVQTAVPTSHVRGTASQTLNTPQWVQINYAGNATISSYKLDGSKIGDRTDSDAEYDMYKEANTRHSSLSTGDKASSSPSGWYELLRFGRNLGRGSAATDKDPLPANAAHWRKINTPEGERWADLNSAGTFKFSDADFPAFLGWNCYGDDTKIADQRCDSLKLKSLLTSEISDAEEKAATLKDHAKLFGQTRVESISKKLRMAICKFPTEFDQGDFQVDFDKRYGHIHEEEHFKSDATGKNWDALCKHIKALTVTDLPNEYKGAQWHLHPLAFIEVMRKCGWLSKNELTQLLPSHALRTGQWKDAAKHKHPGVFWESVSVTAANAESGVIANHRAPLNRTMRKYGITTPLRKASFLGNAIQESGWLSAMQEGGGTDYWYTPWHGRGFLQLTHASNYFSYWGWRGRTIPKELKEAVEAVAVAEAKKDDSLRKKTALADANFSGMTQEIKDWRIDINAATQTARENTGDALVAPADSAGFYWAKVMIQHSDAAHILERVTVDAVDGNGKSTGVKVYYRSPTFWKVSASVNLPSAIDHTNYKGINGFDSRCAAYAVALAVLTEVQFASGTTGATLEYPEGYTPRR